MIYLTRSDKLVSFGTDAMAASMCLAAQTRGYRFWQIPVEYEWPENGPTGYGQRPAEEVATDARIWPPPGYEFIEGELLRQDQKLVDGEVRPKSIQELYADGLITRVEFIERVAAEIKQKANQIITAGFISDALGTDHYYESKEHDQRNLIGAVMLGTARPYPCYEIDENGHPIKSTKEARTHTHQQLKQVLQDGSDRLTATMNRVRELEKELSENAEIDIESGWPE